MPDPKYLLDDSKMQEFIANGFITIKVDLPPGFHEEIYRKTDEVFQKEGNPGNNVLPRIPEIQTVFDQPEVRGAFSSILGHDHTMHVHRHCHFNTPNGKGGGWHKDSYWGYYKLRYLRNRWAMAFYYPQDVELENGPTGVIPHTHCYMDRLKDPDEAGVSVCGEAGTIAIVHFDIWHRAMPNMVDKRRYMMKFQFTRMSEPTQPDWNHNDGAWRNADVGNRHPFVWNNTWEWSRGANANGHAGDVDALARTLQDGDEPARLNAAYELAATGEPAVGPLSRALRSADDGVKLHAAYGLAAVGEPAVSDLVAALGDDDEKVRGHAAFALGDAGPAGRRRRIRTREDAGRSLRMGTPPRGGGPRHHRAKSRRGRARAGERAEGRRRPGPLQRGLFAGSVRIRRRSGRPGSRRSPSRRKSICLGARGGGAGVYRYTGSAQHPPGPSRHGPVVPDNHKGRLVLDAIPVGKRRRTRRIRYENACVFLINH